MVFHRLVICRFYGTKWFVSFTVWKRWLLFCLFLLSLWNDACSWCAVLKLMLLSFVAWSILKKKKKKKKKMRKKKKKKRRVFEIYFFVFFWHSYKNMHNCVIEKQWNEMEKRLNYRYLFCGVCMCVCVCVCVCVRVCVCVCVCVEARLSCLDRETQQDPHWW